MSDGRTPSLRLYETLNPSPLLFNGLSVFPSVKYDLVAAEMRGHHRVRRGRKMNLSIKAAFVIAIAVVPALAFAQSSGPLTRGQVRAQLVQLENAGYNPLGNCSGNCPGSLRQAEAVIAQREASANAAYGPASNGSEQSGK